MNNKKITSYELQVTNKKTVIAGLITERSRSVTCNFLHLIKGSRIKCGMTGCLLFLLSAYSFAQPAFIGSGGSGTAQNPYLISTSKDLVEFSTRVNSGFNACGKYFVLTNDIDMVNVQNFEPIGSNPSGLPFCGNFNGRGFSIKNLSITFTGGNNAVALFGTTTYKANISNLTLDNASFSYSGPYYSFVASFVATAIDTLIMENCVAVNCTLKDTSIGGIVTGLANMSAGYLYDAMVYINNCHVINTKMEGNAVIGFCYKDYGMNNKHKLTIINSSVTRSSLTAIACSGGYGGAATGFISSVQGNDLLSGCCVSDCVISADMNALGFVGSVACSQIYNCYVQASLLRTMTPPPPYTYPNTIGFIGYVYACSYDGGSPYYNATISNCYAACTITTVDNNYTNAASFGGNTAVNATYTNCYYLYNNPLLNAFPNGYSSPNVTGKTQSALKNATMVAYPGVVNNSLNYQQPTLPWKTDFSRDTINKGYPMLAWQVTKYSAAICQGSPYSDANFTNLTQAGFYYDTLQNICKLDSIIELNLIVNPSYIISDTAVISEGESYNFRGKSYTTQGIYRDTLPTIHGCDSIFELVLNITYFTQISDTICKGDIYDFHGNLLTESNIYYDTLRAISGCDSVIELTLTVISIDTTHISAEICQGESYDFFGNLLTTSGVHHHTLQSVNHCDSVIKLTLTVTVGIVETQLIASLPRIYPNPTTGKLRIESGELKIGSVEIYDIYGKKLSQFTFHDSQVEINISHLSYGIYFLKIDGKTMKLVKE